MEFQRFYEWLKKTTKQPTNNSDLNNSGKDENYFLPPFLFCFSKPSRVWLDCVEGRVPSPALQKHVSHLQGVDKAEHCSYLEDGLMGLNTELFPAFLQYSGC